MSKVLIYNPDGSVASFTNTDAGTGGGGTTGANGANGLSVLSGAGAPSNSLGVDGQPGYINTLTGQVYPAKANGVWPAPAYTPLTWITYMTKLTTNAAGGRMQFNLVTRNTTGGTTNASSGYADAVLPFAGTLREIRLNVSSASADVTKVLYIGRSANVSPQVFTDVLSYPLAPFTTSQVFTQSYAQGDLSATFAAGDIIRATMGFATTGSISDFTLYLTFACPNVT